MGLFQHKQQSAHQGDDASAAAAEQFFDEYFREELRNRGRWHFENVINENAALFKKDLDATIAQINVDLKDHITLQLDKGLAEINTTLKEYATTHLDAQVAEYTKTMQDSQEAALTSLRTSAQSLQQQYEQLRTGLQKSLDDQQSSLNNVVEGNNARVAAMKAAQDTALQSLAHSTQVLEEQYKKLNDTLEANVARQEEMLVASFEQNMSRIIEHYILGALGDQFDLKAQLPGIIKQMEANKQAIVDDMKL